MPIRAMTSNFLRKNRQRVESWEFEERKKKKMGLGLTRRETLKKWRRVRQGAKCSAAADSDFQIVCIDSEE